MIKTYNPTVIFLKFTLNIKIYKEFERFLSKLERNFVLPFTHYDPILTFLSQTKCFSFK